MFRGHTTLLSVVKWEKVEHVVPMSKSRASLMPEISSIFELSPGSIYSTFHSQFLYWSK